MKINGGYYIKARKIQESKIHRFPPYVREIWDWLLMNANHSDNKYNGHTIKRGQLFRTYKDIREGLAWYVGYRKEMYNENHTKKGMKSLREADMIATTKELGGVMITILNYDKYQNPKNYENTSDGTNEGTKVKPRSNQGSPDSNKKLKKEKEIFPPSFLDVQKYCLERKNGIDAQSFIDHYETSGWMRGNNKIKSWKACIRTWEKNNKSKPKVDIYIPESDLIRYDNDGNRI